MYVCAHVPRHDWVGQDRAGKKKERPYSTTINNSGKRGKGEHIDIGCKEEESMRPCSFSSNLASMKAHIIKDPANRLQEGQSKHRINRQDRRISIVDTCTTPRI
eukprot:919984-Pelagomonas_calceolata.AAC.1